MIALARPGSLPWLVLHDVRVKARGREGRWGRIIAMLLLALHTGQRRADLAKMRFDDVVDGHLRVEQQPGL
jgi:integrase